MGAVAILADSVIWAFTSTLITSKLARIDFLSVATFRLIFAAAFIWPAMFVLGAQGALWDMSFHTMWQLGLGGFAGYLLAEPGYALTLSLLGLTRGYTVVIGIFSLSAFVLPVIFLGESLEWQSIVGGVLILTGVVIVTARGRAPTSTPAVAPSPNPTLDYDPHPSDPHPTTRPIDGGSDTALATSAPATHVRLPGTTITLPRIVAGIIAATATAILWATGLTILRAISPGIDAAAVATAQLMPSALVILVLYLLVRRGRVFDRSVTPSNASLMGLTGAMTAGFGTILVVFAVERIGAGPTAVLFAMSTIFALPLGVIFLKERVTIWGVGGATLAVGGVALLV